MGSIRARVNQRGELDHVRYASDAFCPEMGNFDGSVRVGRCDSVLDRSSSSHRRRPHPSPVPRLSSPLSALLPLVHHITNPITSIALFQLTSTPAISSHRLFRPSRHIAPSVSPVGMADQSFSSAFPNSNKPSSMEGAFASLGFDTPTGTVSLCHSHAHQVLDAARSASSSRMQPISRQHSANNNAAVNLDPVLGDPGSLFIKPPFTDYPGSEKQKTGLTYNILAAHPDWFLDVNDFIGPNAVVYPPQLEPPRGWCPTKKKDAKDGWKEGEEPRLRCTLCRRQYAGVNAKSMWRRHVYEKHKIAMANRRETNDRPSGRGARSSNSTSVVYERLCFTATH